MTKLLASISSSMMTVFAILALPSLASAQTTYYRGNILQKTQEKQSPEQKAFDERMNRQVLVELTSSPTNVKIRILEPVRTNPSALNFHILEYKKQGSTWTQTSTMNPKPIPSTLTYAGPTLRTISTSMSLAQAKVDFHVDLANPLAYYSESKVVGTKGQTIMSETIDAGLILANQFETALKGKQLVPMPKPTPFKPPANIMEILKKREALQKSGKK